MHRWKWAVLYTWLSIVKHNQHQHLIFKKPVLHVISWVALASQKNTLLPRHPYGHPKSKNNLMWQVKYALSLRNSCKICLEIAKSQQDSLSKINSYNNYVDGKVLLPLQRLCYFSHCKKHLGLLILFISKQSRGQQHKRPRAMPKDTILR